MKKSVIYVIIIIFSFFLGNAMAAIVASQKYYVTYSGSGNRNGTSYANSWSWSDFLSSSNWSPYENVSKIDPGDTIYLSGTFNITGTVNNIPGSGTSGNYITIDGNDGVHTAATINPNGSADGAFGSVSQSYLVFANLSFTGSAYAPLKIQYGSYVDVHGCTLNGSYDRGIWYRYMSHGNVYNNTVTSTKTDAQNDGIKMISSSYINIYRNTISDWSHAGIDCLNTKDDIPDGDTHDISIYNNYFDLPNRGYGRAFAAETWNAGRTYNIYIYRNYIKDMRTRSQIASVSYVYVYDNIFYNTQNCCESSSDTGCSEIAADPKCFADTYWKTGQHLSVETSYGNTSYIYIYNNTFYKSSEAALAVSNAGGNVDNLHISNNIFNEGSILSDPGDDPPGSTNAWDKTIQAYVDKAKYSYSNISFTNNIVYTSGRSTDIYWGGTAYTVDGFNKAYAWASNNQQADPKFINPAKGNFALQDTSPAIDSGSTLQDTFALKGSGSTLNSYNLAWDPNSLLPPNSVKTLDQDNLGNGWEIGAYIFSGNNGETVVLGAPKGLMILIK